MFRTEVKFLGKLCTQEGLCISPDKIEAVKKWATPTTQREIESFLGFANYHREHIQGFAGLTAVLYKLTGKTEFHWTPEHDEAFQKLKVILTSAPCLAYPRPEGKFILDTDASDTAIGAELSQVQDGIIKPIAYASNILLPAHRNYCVTRKELLAVVKFCNHFRHYLLGRTFLVRTDHNSLVWLQRFRHLEGQLARWQEQLAQYSLEIVHRSGSKHSNADALSRLPNRVPECDCYNAGTRLEDLPCGGCHYCTKAHHEWARFCEDVDDVIPLAVRSITVVDQHHGCQEQSPDVLNISEVVIDENPTSKLPPTIDSSANNVQSSQTQGNSSAFEVQPSLIEESPQDVEEARNIQSNWMQPYTPDEIRALQLEDQDLKPIILWLEHQEVPLPDVLFSSSAATKAYWGLRLHLKLVDGVLYYKWKNKQDRRLCLVVPCTLRKLVLKLCHDAKNAGHFAQNKTKERLKRSFLWYKMGEESDLYVLSCDVCARNKGPARPPRTALRSFHAGYPMERVHLDVLGPFTISACGNKYILMMVDQFTKWVECAAIPEQSAETVAVKFISHFVSPLGFPTEIHTDQGRNFDGQLFRAFCERFDIAKTRTTPYHPSSNGQVERYNRVLLPMIRSYIEGKQRYWDKDLALLVIALHSTVHRQTGFTPNRLMLGREVSQPIEILLGVADKNIQSRTPVEWVDNLCTELTRTHQVVRERLKSTQRRQKKDYNLRGLREKSYDVGDLVYKRDQSTKIGVSSKLQSPYKGPYLVVKAHPPVYAIQDRKRESVVHHDKLLPCRSSEIPFWLKRKRHQLFSSEEPNPLEILEETILGLTDQSISTRSA